MLVCYAMAASAGVTLAAAAVVLVGALWCGPGGSRLRSPVNRVVRPLSRGVRGWLIAVAVVVAVGGLLGGLAAHGADWLPAGGAPFSGLSH
jgi:heme A synthase